ncbi:MAG: LCP family protein [Bacilli bacterium]|jgi:LCP family protein required for cell wall assembly|nr:LCP family protein [Bacilli bacterium]
MNEKKKRGHDINFYRGNLTKNDYDNIKSEHDYRDFKFNHNQRKTVPRSYEEGIDFNKMKVTELDEKIEVLKAKKKIRDSQSNSKINNDLYLNNNDSLDECDNNVQDEIIRKTKRKPLKPNRETHDSNDKYYNDINNHSNNGRSNKYRMKREAKQKDRKVYKKKKRRFIKGIILVILLLLLSIAGSLFLIKNTSPVLNFVVIGVDQRSWQDDSEVRADAIMMVNASSKDEKIIMASIPRDTYTEVPCLERKDKITHAYVYGAMYWQDKGGSIACTTASVSKLTNIETNKYVKINFDDTIGIINAIDGIDLKATHSFCEQNSKSVMNAFCFEEGKTYHMDGEMALAYARHRKSDSDIARGLRQQEVFKGIISKVKKMPFWEWPNVYLKTSTMVKTNLTHKEMMQIALVYIFKGDTTNYKFDWYGTMYGGVSYVELEPESVQKYTKTVNDLH